MTHQACVAARAAGHFRVHKLESDGRTRTEVERLSQTSRVDELMRMLSGSRTENARRLAMDLVNAARSERRPERKRPCGLMPRARDANGGVRSPLVVSLDAHDLHAQRARLAIRPLGGEEAVRRLAESFYDQMEATEAELARLHS